jgi:hypothetical protein
MQGELEERVFSGEGSFYPSSFIACWMDMIVAMLTYLSIRWDAWEVAMRETVYVGV